VAVATAVVLLALAAAAAALAAALVARAALQRELPAVRDAGDRFRAEVQPALARVRATSDGARRRVGR
jgi:hypothetical protein